MYSYAHVPQLQLWFWIVRIMSWVIKLASLIKWKYYKITLHDLTTYTFPVGIGIDYIWSWHTSSLHSLSLAFSYILSDRRYFWLSLSWKRPRYVRLGQPLQARSFRVDSSICFVNLFSCILSRCSNHLSTSLTILVTTSCYTASFPYHAGFYFIHHFNHISQKHLLF